MCTRELKRQRTIHLRSRRPHRLEENEDDDNIDNEREKEGLERVEKGIFLSFYSAIRKNMQKPMIFANLERRPR